MNRGPHSGSSAGKERTMDITRTIADMKKEPEFADHVGMILTHNGVVRGWSRKDRSAVAYG